MRRGERQSSGWAGKIGGTVKGACGSDIPERLESCEQAPDGPERLCVAQAAKGPFLALVPQGSRRRRPCSQEQPPDRDANQTWVKPPAPYRMSAGVSAGVIIHLARTAYRNAF